MDDTVPLVESEDESEEDQFSTWNSQEKRHYLESLDLDKLLEERLGQFGKFQKVIFVLLSFSTILPSIVFMASVFTTISPEHRCYIPGCDDPEFHSYDDWIGFKNFSIPQHAVRSEDFESCFQYERVQDIGCSINNFKQTIVPCSRYVYDHSLMKNTVSMKYNLVCDRKRDVDLSQSIFFAGVLVGAPVFGHLGDSIGRKPVFLVSLLLTVTSSLCMLYAPGFILYNILQFLSAMGSMGLYQNCFVLGVELIGPSYRVLCSVVMQFFDVAGEVILPGIAYYFRDWEKMTLAYIVPSSSFLAFFFIIPRSVRWLLAKQRYLEAEQELQRVAKWNKRDPLSKHDFKKYSAKKQEVEVMESFYDLAMRPRLIIRLNLMFLCWTVLSMVYYGLSLCASTFSGNVFLNFTLLSLAEIPGNSMSYFGMQYSGRNITMKVSLLLSGFACITYSLLGAVHSNLKIFVLLVGKFGMTCAFTTAYLYTSELFPTSVRNLCLGLCSMVGNIGTIIAPYIKSLGSEPGKDWIPMAIFGISGIVSGVAMFFLNETKGKPLPSTLDEAEDIDVHQKA